MESNFSDLRAAMSDLNNSISVAVGGEMNKRAVEQAREARRWAMKEREIANDFTREMFDKTNAWNLEQWNREVSQQEAWRDYDNDYNSPTAQRKRLEAAGYNPLSAIPSATPSETGSVNSVSAAGGSPSIASAPSLPQLENPMAHFDPFGGMKMNLAYKELQLKDKELDARINSMGYDNAYKQSLTDTENQLRKGKVTLQGVQIDLGKSQSGLTDAQRDKVAHEIVKIDTEVSNMLQAIKESQVRTSYTSFREYAERVKLPKETRILCEQWLGLKRDNWSKLQANKERAEYYNSGQWAQDVRSSSRDLLNRSYITQYQRYYSKESFPLQLEQLRGQTKSEFSYSVDKGMNTVSNIVQPFAAAGQALQGYGIWMMSGAKIQQMQPSTPNP